MLYGVFVLFDIEVLLCVVYVLYIVIVIEVFDDGYLVIELVV